MGAREFAEKIAKPKMRALKRKLNKKSNEDVEDSPNESDDSPKTQKLPEKKVLVKNAPEEASSKRRPPKLRQVVQGRI